MPKAKNKQRKRYRKPTPEVSERMRRVKSKGTSIELAMEGILKDLGIEYEVQPDLPGHPDYSIKGTNVLIFCDSSFWHGKREKEITGEAFKKNKEFWVKKLEYNRKRDERNNRALRRQGWSVHRLLDTEILRKPEKVTKRLKRVIAAKKHKGVT